MYADPYTAEEAATIVRDLLGTTRIEAAKLLRRLAIARPDETLAIGDSHTVRFLTNGWFTIGCSDPLCRHLVIRSDN